MIIGIGVIWSFLQRGFMTEMNIFNTYLMNRLKYTISYDICKPNLLFLSEIIMSTGGYFNINVVNI